MTKHAIVTGGSAGIGLAVARALAAKGFALTLISSNSERLARAAQHLRNFTSQTIETAAVDFSNLDLVKEFAIGFSYSWDLLINNAGIKIQKDAAPTAQGFERHMGINHLAHFVLTKELLARANANARIVSVSSIVARVAPKDVFGGSDLNVSERYAASKLANLGFALELDARLKDAGSAIRSVAAHPGFTRAEPYGGVLTRIGEYLLAQSVDSGAKPIVEAALSAVPETFTGPRAFELWGSPAAARINLLAQDANWRKALWLESEALTETSFEVY